MVWSAVLFITTVDPLYRRYLMGVTSCAEYSFSTYLKSFVIRDVRDFKIIGSNLRNAISGVAKVHIFWFWAIIGLLS